MVGMSTTKQRKFNGKVYNLYDWCATKREAVKEAKELRKSRQKYQVRVVPAGTGYHIYRR